MVIKTVTPSDVYQNISLEVDHILQNLAQTTSDPSLQQANDNACQQLDGFRQKLNKNIESLQKNAEWDTFTIAFYGETNAGKSTVIETLRILLNEKVSFHASRHSALFNKHISLLTAISKSCSAICSRMKNVPLS